MNEINKENGSKILSAFITGNKLELKEVANAINCSIATLQRIISHKTVPTENMITQISVITTLGFNSYVNLSLSQKETVSENMGKIGGGVIGLGSITPIVSAAGTTGLSAVGISSGLTAIGGSMVGGIAIVAIIPIAAGVLGFGIIKGIKVFLANKKLSAIEIDSYWETPISPATIPILIM